MDEHFDLTYKSLFRRYYTNLLFYATRIVGEEDAEELLVQVRLRGAGGQAGQRYHEGGRADSGFFV